MITIKSGVPGSGKSQSMVADLMAMVAQMKKTGQFRPIYTNITGLKQDVVPHFVLDENPAAWLMCPPESIVVIDEAQKCGFEALSNAAKVPEYIKELAVHRKDYSLDIWFITQNPKLLHMYCRTQCGKHQHYERKFGLQSAFCYEWHECHDNVTSKKNAVISRFNFSKKYQNAYHSADVHTKPSFKVPLWVWVPVLVIPLGIYAGPKAYYALSGAMTGKGIAQPKEEVSKNEVKKEFKIESGQPVAVPVQAAAASAPGPASSNPPVFAALAPAAEVKQIAGCVATPKRCSCYYSDGTRGDVEETMCRENLAITGMPKNVQELDIKQTSVTRPGDLEVLAAMNPPRLRPMALNGY